VVKDENQKIKYSGGAGKPAPPLPLKPSPLVG